MILSKKTKREIKTEKEEKEVVNMKTEVTELLGIEYPIIQGGMAWVAEYHLAAGVSNAGGLGLLELQVLRRTGYANRSGRQGN